MLQQQFLKYVGKALKGLALDSAGNAWVASQGDIPNGRIYLFDPDGNEVGSFSGGGIDGPWGITVDGEDNVWVANFGPLDLNRENNFTGRLTKFWGVNAPPGHNVGDPISPPSGYTVPTAGSEVLLYKGKPLYGQHGPSCLIPMMRQTALGIDQAGNIWSLKETAEECAVILKRLWRAASLRDLPGKARDQQGGAVPHRVCLSGSG